MPRLIETFTSDRARRPSPFELLVEALRRGRSIDDHTFDQVYPLPVRHLSEHFWTPVTVAVRAVQLLALDSSARVLDIGAGVGKFCIIGAAASQATFAGIEQRPALVDVARRALETISAPRVRVDLGTLETARWDDFDVFYLYNPFEENLSDIDDRIDDAVLLSQERFCRDVRLVERVLERARAGTRVITYHGFGGRIPRGYRLRVDEICGTGSLRLWVKAGNVSVRKRVEPETEP